mgnify:CR=1 FL=1
MDLFLVMASQLLGMAPGESDFEFHVIGDGPLRDRLEAESNALTIDERVTFHGHCKNAASYITSLDVLVMCSDHEGSPMTLLESMALGTPVVAHHCGSMKSVYAQEIGGVLSETHSACSYAQATLKVLKGSSFRELLIDRASCWFDSNGNAKKNAEQFLELYKGLM